MHQKKVLVMKENKCLRKKKAKQPATYGWLTQIAMTINYTVGTGMLALPLAVGNGSMVLTVLLLFVANISSALMSVYGNDALARAYALKHANMTWRERKHLASRKTSSQESNATAVIQISEVSKPHSPALSSDLGNKNSDTDLPKSRDDVPPDGPPPSRLPLTELPDFTIPTAEVLIYSELMGVFFGPAGFYIAQTLNSVMQLTAVWSYFNVVSQSLTSVIPFPALPAFKNTGQTQWVCAGPCQTNPPYYDYCNQAYWIWTCITYVFAQIVVFFSLAEQKVLQTIFTYARFLVIVMCIAIAAISLGVSPFDSVPTVMHAPYFSPTNKILYYNSSGVGNMFSLLIFSLTFQNCVPHIVQAVREEDKKYLNRGFFVTFSVISVFTALMLFVGGSFFGTRSSSLVTLNFTTWDGLLWGSPDSPKPWWAHTISYVTRIIPPVYIISAIPINCIVMRDSLVAFLPQRFQKRKIVITICNFLSVASCMLLSGFVRCLNVILNYASLVCYFILLSPAMMSFFGKLQMIKVFGKENGYRSPYYAWYCHPAVI